MDEIEEGIWGRRMGEYSSDRGIVEGIWEEAKKIDSNARRG
jgi:hypothetical protein